MSPRPLPSEDAPESHWLASIAFCLALALLVIWTRQTGTPDAPDAVRPNPGAGTPDAGARQPVLITLPENPTLRPDHEKITLEK